GRARVREDPRHRRRRGCGRPGAQGKGGGLQAERRADLRRTAVGQGLAAAGGRGRLARLAGYQRDDALALARLGRRGRCPPAGLPDAATEGVEPPTPRVNAGVMNPSAFGRRAIADGLPDGPFTGVPYLLKDLTASLAGVPMTRGSRFFADSPPA